LVSGWIIGLIVYHAKIKVRILVIGIGFLTAEAQRFE
jgi:hypothetical protein